MGMGRRLEKKEYILTANNDTFYSCFQSNIKFDEYRYIHIPNTPVLHRYEQMRVVYRKN